MKVIYMIAAACLLSMNVFAGSPNSKEHPTKYCTRLTKGKLVIMHEGKALTSNVTLTNGTVIKTDGTVVKKDGSTTMLKENQCVDKDGKIMEENQSK